MQNPRFGGLRGLARLRALLLCCLFVVACGDGEARRDRDRSAAGSTDAGGATSIESSRGGSAGVPNGGAPSGEGGNGGIAGSIGGTSNVTGLGGANNASGGVGGIGGTGGAATSSGGASGATSNGGTNGATGGTTGNGGTSSATAGTSGNGGTSGASGGTTGNGGTSGAGGVTGDPIERLERIEGIRVVSREILSTGAIRFNLTIEQPNDHEQPAGPKFEQKIQLLHRSVDAPVVLISTGYDIEMGFGGSELVPMLGANQLGIEHRFFGTSKPDPLDWSLLNIEQAAADTHHIVESLRGLYTGPWLSTGASKGGMASVYHRRFYPRRRRWNDCLRRPHFLWRSGQ
ncbi:MAG: S28 family serine protease [Polyangiaceae bacterium]